MIIRAKKSLVLMKNGKLGSILRPMLTERPMRGWSTAIVIKGTRIELRGSNPDEVIHAMKKALESNGVEFISQDLWMTANYLWISNAPSSKCLVHLSDFKDAVEFPEGEGLAPGMVEPNQWLTAHLDSFGYFLCVDKEEYSFDSLRPWLTAAVTLANPSKSPRTGDLSILSIFLEAQDKLLYEPPYLIGSARKWFSSLCGQLSPYLKDFPKDTESLELRYNWIDEA